MHKKVLIVCFDSGQRDHLEHELRQAEHQVTAVNEGREAWAMLEAGCEFDQVIAAADLPDMEGLDLARQMRADGRMRRIQFALMTANGVPIGTEPIEEVERELDIRVIKPPRWNNILDRLRLDKRQSDR